MAEGLTKDGLRTAATPPLHSVEACGGVVWLGEMTAQQWAGLERRFSAEKATADPMAYRYALLHATLRNPDGSAMFSDEKEATAVLSQLRRSQVLALFDEAQKANGIAAKQQEDSEKNSESNPG